MCLYVSLLACNLLNKIFCNVMEKPAFHIRVSKSEDRRPPVTEWLSVLTILPHLNHLITLSGVGFEHCMGHM